MASPIEHVFVLMLENRSFDHFLALSGIPGIVAATPNDPAFTNSLNGKTYYFGGGAPEAMPTDPLHEFDDVVEQLTTCGKFVAGQPYPPRNNGGFVANYATTGSKKHPLDPEQFGLIMAGADPAQLPATTALARSFVLCDHWYSSLPGPTWPNRFFLHGASSMGYDFSPSLWQLIKWETFDGFEYANGSVFDALGAGNWRLYQDKRGPLVGRIPQVASLKGLTYFDVHGFDRFESDLAGDYPWAYTFIEPAYGNIVDDSYRGGSSQHPMDSIAGGDALVAEVYNALRNSPLRDRSLLVVTYDEHGGFYDSQPPVPLTPPGDLHEPPPYGGNGFDFSLSGVRVPAIVVSPWVARGAVDRTEYDHSSIAATLTGLFGTSSLTDRDRAANGLGHLLADTMRDDCPVSIEGAPPPPETAAAFLPMDAATAAEPVPENGNLGGFLYVVEKARRETGAAPETVMAQLAPTGLMTRGEAAAYLETNVAALEQARINAEGGEPA